MAFHSGKLKSRTRSRTSKVRSTTYDHNYDFGEVSDE